MNVSVVVSTRNRSVSLTRLLVSVRGLADEIIIVDNDSTDETRDVAKKFGAKIFRRPNNPMLNVNKNYGFTKAMGDWILCLDDDEEIPSELAHKIKEITHHPSHIPHTSDVVGYWIPRKNIIFGKWIEHGIWWPDRQLRLFRRGSGRYPEKHVHEYITVSGQTEHLKHPFVHYNYDSLSQYLSKMQDIYIGSEVEKLVATGYRVDWRDAIRFPVSDFLKLYFSQSGYKDGLHGLVLSVLQAFYAFIIFVKLWEREKFREVDMPLQNIVREMSRSQKETSYWVRSTVIKETSNPIERIWRRLLRKIHHVS